MAGPEVVDDLSVLLTSQPAQGLDFDDDTSVANKIGPVSDPQLDVCIRNRKADFACPRDSPFVEFDFKRGSVDRLEEARSQGSVDLHGGPDDFIRLNIFQRLPGRPNPIHPLNLWMTLPLARTGTTRGSTGNPRTISSPRRAQPASNWPPRSRNTHRGHGRRRRGRVQIAPRAA